MRDWVVDVVRSLGAVGVGMLMLAENLVPPIPSELIMPLAGYLSARGELSFAGAVAAGTAGSLLGATAWYWVGRRVGEERLTAWLGRYGVSVGLCPDDVRRGRRLFDRYGPVVVLVGRLVPVVRTFVSVPAGISRMPLPTFLLYSAVGTALWTAGLAAAGRLLGQHFPAVGRFVGAAAWAVFGAAAVGYVVRVARFRRSPPAG